jgi:hypothetical protein
MNRSSVIEMIRTAWSFEPQPSHDQIAYDNSGRHLECAAVRAFFTGKSWEEVTWPILSTYRGDRSACLCFMSPTAFRYYISSYMLIAIEHYADADVAGDSAWFGLEPRDGRVFTFTTPQRAAICAFVEYMQATHADEAPYDEHPKVVSYWRVAR